MSWHFSQALVAEYSAVTYSDGAQSAPSNTTPTPETYYWPDKTTEHSRLSRFGMTCEPLTVIPGEELLMSYRAAFLARTSAQQEKVQDLTASEADFGPRWHGSFARYSRDSSSWKTAQCSLVEDLEKFSETWPRWGSMRSGVSYLRQIPALPICESASGFVPNNENFFHTPNCAGMDGGSNSRKAIQQRMRLQETGMFPTPRARDSQPEGLEAGMRRIEKYSTCSLSTAVTMFPTPVASNQKAHSKRGDDKGKEREPRSYGAHGQLNPDWVEWLMGWPIGWTDLKPLETARFQEWLRQHGNY